ncbi:MAG TPA: hypothetical protein DDX98_14020 [Bacteroidales bacterium]|jgi:beta-glucanase (GH16 family)|nr:hypothetical protein [Bacteroidales bacterium]
MLYIFATTNNFSGMKYFQLELKRPIFFIALLLTSAFTRIDAQLVIEAEDYSQMKGVQTENTTDDGGGLNVGWIDNNDWMEYKISIPVAGDYEISYRIASQSGGGVADLLIVETLAQKTMLPATGGWQTWSTVQGDSLITLPEGETTIKVKAASGGFNLNWWQLRLVNPADSDNPSAVVITETQTDVHDVYMAWNKSIDPTTVVSGYDILMNGSLFAKTSDTTVTLSKLPPGLEMDFALIAKDLSGNTSDTTFLTVQTDTLPWEITWSDEFNIDGEVDRTKWNFQTGGGGWGNGEAQYYTDGDNAIVSGGNLIIEARKETIGSNKYTSTRMNSSGKGDFLFGRLEARMKLPSTGGTWPAFWTLPTDWVYGNWPNCGEIDIMEHSATYNYGHILGTIHTGAYNHIAGTQKSGGIHIGDVTDTYHTYVIEWFPDHIDWYVDDIHIFTYVNEYKSTEEWPFDVAHHVLLNVAIGGAMGGDIDDNGAWPQQMIVDYVRYYDFKLGENDTIAPEKPANITIDAKGNLANTSWNLAKDNFVVDKYIIYLDDMKIDSTKGTSLQIFDLEPETHYIFSIAAVDEAGNESDTASVAFTTPELTGIAVPGKIQAEDYTQMSGIDTEDCEDTGGGTNVGWIDAGDWMTYTIDVAENNEYRAKVRVAGQSSSGTIVFYGDDDRELTTVNTSPTGGWQTWTSVVTGAFDLEAGIQTLKVSATKGGFNLNWIEIGKSSDMTSLSYLTDKDIQIYPNPFHGEKLNISVPAEFDNFAVQIVSVDGKLVHSQEYDKPNGLIQINNNKLLPGVYLITISSQKSVITKMLSVQ